MNSNGTPSWLWKRPATPAAACLGLLLLAAQPGIADMAYVGGTDPVLQGWVATGNLSGVFASFFGVPTWQINDDSTAANSTLFYSAQQFPVPGEPWTFRAKLRTPGIGFSLDDAIDMGVFFEVTDSTSRRFLVQFGSVGPGGVIPGTTWVHLVSSATSTPTISDSWVLSPDNDFMLVELASDGTTADLFMNGYLLASGHPGFVQASVPPRVLWGEGSSAATGTAQWAEASYVTGTQACSNGVDDDGNGLVDALDPYCASPLDPREGPPPIPCVGAIDQDGDGICDVNELEVGTSVTDADSDGDGLSDGDEVLAGTDPLDALSPPPFPVPALSGGGVVALVALLGIVGIRARSA